MVTGMDTVQKVAMGLTTALFERVIALQLSKLFYR